MQITIDVERETGLFLKEELGEGTIAGEQVSFGIGLPSGTPYIHLRGEYYLAPRVFEAMIRTVHGQEEHEGHGEPCDEHTAQPASTPEAVAEVVRAYDAGQ